MRLILRLAPGHQIEAKADLDALPQGPAGPLVGVVLASVSSGWHGQRHLGRRSRLNGYAAVEPGIGRASNTRSLRVGISNSVIAVSVVRRGHHERWLVDDRFRVRLQIVSGGARERF